MDVGQLYEWLKDFDPETRVAVWSCDEGKETRFYGVDMSFDEDGNEVVQLLVR